ncbi:MAG: hypothetical protein ACREXI_09985 [Caldimonas sp.]
MTTVITFPTLDSFLRGALIAGLCVLGGAVAANAAPAKAKSSTHRTAKKAPAKPVETAPADATPEQFAAAEKVYYGAYDCEFNQKVDIEKNAKYPGYVDVKSGKSVWAMKPVVSSTGAIRLEDVKGETLMVQISSKSMLLNVKTAHRIVDACTCPQQRELVAAAKMAKEAEMARVADGTSTSTAAAAPPLLMNAVAPAGSASATK